MGTRHLIAVQVDGQYPIAQYGQWDGYPDGQGLTVLRFLRDELRRNDLIAKAKAAPEMTQELRSAKLRELGHDGSEGVSDAVATKYYNLHPQLSRDVGGKILAMVQDGEMGAPLRRDITFAGESLFCEWAWVVDLDKNTFEAFEGCNTQPLDPGERFASTPIDEKAKSLDEEQYYQVRHVATWSLDALPTDEEFLATFVEPEDAREEGCPT